MMCCMTSSTIQQILYDVVYDVMAYNTTDIINYDVLHDVMAYISLQ